MDKHSFRDLRGVIQVETSPSALLVCEYSWCSKQEPPTWLWAHRLSTFIWETGTLSNNVLFYLNNTCFCISLSPRLSRTVFKSITGRWHIIWLVHRCRYALMYESHGVYVRLSVGILWFTDPVLPPFILFSLFLSFTLLLFLPIIKIRRKIRHEIEEYESEERIIKCKKIKHVEIEFWKQNDTSFKEEWNPNKIVKSSICEHTS